MFTKLGLLVSYLALVLVLGDYGHCRYDPDKCSCKYGKENQGICWDKINGAPGLCKRRFCKAGWTCSCYGRTHLCTVAKKSVNVLKNAGDKDKSSAECLTKSVSLVNGRELLLGKFKIFLSRAGVEANDCNSIAWWLDGKLHGYHYSEPDMSKATVDKVLEVRQDHSLLELRPNSLLAFRVQNGSYYCFKHYAEMVVNGVKMNTQSSGVTVHYSRKFTTDWYMPHYKLTPDKIGSSENDDDSKFLSLRKTKLMSSEAIVPGNDYWAPSEPKAGDTMRSNWYFRIQLSPPMITV